jgi:hypothetical protein
MAGVSAIRGSDDPVAQLEVPTWKRARHMLEHLRPRRGPG